MNAVIMVLFAHVLFKILACTLCYIFVPKFHTTPKTKYKQKCAPPGGDYMARTRSLSTVASLLSDIATTFDVAVVVINQMTTHELSLISCPQLLLFCPAHFTKE